MCVCVFCCCFWFCFWGFFLLKNGSGICAFSSAPAPRLSAESITRPPAFQNAPFPWERLQPSCQRTDLELGAIPCGMPCSPGTGWCCREGAGMKVRLLPCSCSPAVSAFCSRSRHLCPVPAMRREASLRGTLFCKPHIHQLINSWLSSRDKLINRPRRFSQA